MVNVRVKISGLDQGFARRQAVTIQKFSQRQIEAMARETERVIKEKITERIERAGSEGNLADSFFALPISDGWGVGDIAFLNQNAPYWYWQNFGVAQSGRRVPPKSSGQFSPGIPQPTPGQTGGRWEQSNTGGFVINPRKPIDAKNYIQATINEVNRIVAEVTRRVKL